MPYRDPDPSDPNMLVGVSLPPNRESTREMAWVFAEEFVQLGFNEDRLLTLFRRPFYAGAHQAYRLLGEPEIRSIVREALEFWGRRRIVVKDKQADAGWRPLRLPSLSSQRLKS